jgi:hypothetical protein
MRGVPVIAVKRNLPVKGTKLTANDIYSPADQCRWLHDMYTIVPDKAGAQEYYNSIFELYASWGLDFVKVDDLSSPIYFSGEVEMIRKAIERTGRKILLSTSPGETPIDHADHVQQHANMWRTVGDFWDSWRQLKEHFEVFERWNKWRTAGAYPDGDMLPLGRIGIRAERGDPRMTNFTRDEQYTLMTLWSIFKSPLMFGGNFPDNDRFTDSLITNKNMLYVLKKSINNKPLFRNEKQAAWVAKDPTDGSTFLAVFNMEDAEEMIESKAIWKSGVINRQQQSEMIDVKLNGSRKLYLTVSGVDNTDWDHADWINPVLYKGNDTISLTTLKWTKATAGWGKPRVNRSVSGGDLIVDVRQLELARQHGLDVVSGRAHGHRGEPRDGHGGRSVRRRDGQLCLRGDAGPSGRRKLGVRLPALREHHEGRHAHALDAHARLSDDRHAGRRSARVRGVQHRSQRQDAHHEVVLPGPRAGVADVQGHGDQAPEQQRPRELRHGTGRPVD